jgi:hypothetical protein
MDGNKQGQHGQNECGYQSLLINLASLIPYPGQFNRIFNLFFNLAQLARSSRRKTYSGLVSPLKKAGSGSSKERE